jgi:hypothetical protein
MMTPLEQEFFAMLRATLRTYDDAKTAKGFSERFGRNLSEPIRDLVHRFQDEFEASAPIRKPAPPQTATAQELFERGQQIIRERQAQ